MTAMCFLPFLHVGTGSVNAVEALCWALNELQSVNKRFNVLM